MTIFLSGILIFVLAICTIELLTLALRQVRSPERANIRKRLRKYAYEENSGGTGDLLRRRILSDIPWLDRLLRRLAPTRELDRLIVQANAPHTVGFYLLLTPFLAAFAFLGSWFFLKQTGAALLIGGVAAGLPYLYLLSKKRARIEKFRRQMPEALDLVARSLKAGHALPSGMKLAAEQFDDPLGPEFSETIDEINFGVSVANALKNLAARMNCMEVRYFVVAVILQRETGGNLSELMESLADLIRENYKFQGKVSTLSAEGRMSAIVLIGLPFAVGGYLKLSSPKYLEPLLTTHIGRLMLLAAAIMMLLGIIVIQRMVKIDV